MHVHVISAALQKIINNVLFKHLISDHHVSFINHQIVARLPCCSALNVNPCWSGTILNRNRSERKHLSSHLDLKMQLNPNENNVDAKNGDDDDEITDATTLSLARSTTNDALSNSTASSFHVSVNYGVENVASIPVRKRKIELDTWNSIKRMLDTNFLKNDQEGMTHVGAKCSAIINFS